MKNYLLLLRISYWWGIITDAAMAVLMLFPNLFVHFMNVNLKPDIGFKYGLINSAPLMIGWTILMFWASRKPVERKDILPLTLPVVAGYAAIQAHGILTGLTTLRHMLPLFVSQTCMSSLFVFSYLNAPKIEHKDRQ